MPERPLEDEVMIVDYWRMRRERDRFREALEEIRDLEGRHGGPGQIAHEALSGGDGHA